MNQHRCCRTPRVVPSPLLGVGFVACALGFCHDRSTNQARRVLRASLVYLPALFAVLLVDVMLTSWAGPR